MVRGLPQSQFYYLFPVSSFWPYSYCVWLFSLFFSHRPYTTNLGQEEKYHSTFCKRDKLIIFTISYRQFLDIENVGQGNALYLPSHTFQLYSYFVSIFHCVIYWSLCLTLLSLAQVHLVQFSSNQFTSFCFTSIHTIQFQFIQNQHNSNSEKSQNF